MTAPPPFAPTSAAPRHVGLLAALLLAWLVAGRAAAASPCPLRPGNLVRNCDFARGITGWRRQAATQLAPDRRGHDAPGSLLMTNEPASEAGAATCVAVEGGASYELSGWLRRLLGRGECLTFIEEHATTDCSAGALASHELVSTPLVPGTFTRVAGTATVGARTVAIRAGFACYGEHDDDVSGVLLDDVVLRKVEGASGAASASQGRPSGVPEPAGGRTRASARAVSPTSPGPR